MEIRVKKIMERDIEGNEIVIHELDFSIPDDVKFLEISDKLPREMIDYIKNIFNLHGEIRDIHNHLRGTIMLYELQDWEIREMNTETKSEMPETDFAGMIEKSLIENSLNQKQKRKNHFGNGEPL